MEVPGAHASMMGGCMVLGEVIGIVFETTAPVDDELAVGDAVFNPVETHVDGFGAALFDGIVGNSIPIARDGVEGFEGSEEMFGVLAADILDSKIIYAEGEADWASIVEE